MWLSLCAFTVRLWSMLLSSYEEEKSFVVRSFRDSNAVWTFHLFSFFFIRVFELIASSYGLVWFVLFGLGVVLPARFFSLFLNSIFLCFPPLECQIWRARVFCIWLSNFDIEDVLNDIINSGLDLRHWANHR